jgi:rhamnosyl/mannosyltransferase
LFHFHFPYPWAELSFLFSGVQKPYIVSYHSDIVKQKHLLKLWGPFMRRFLAGAARIVVASPHIIESSPVLSGPLAHKTAIIPYGIDTDFFLPTSESHVAAQKLRSNLSASRPLLFFLGRLVYYKGVHVLIEAMRGLDAHLIIGGEGPLRGELERAVQKAELGSKITFVGNIPQDQLPLYYQAADLFVLPSTDTSEAFGMVMLESHASGTPVVSTNLPTGVVYVNQHGGTGICVPPRDPKALTEAIQSLLANPSVRLEMGVRAQKRAQEQFDTKVMCRSYLDLYHDIFSQANRS